MHYFDPTNHLHSISNYALALLEETTGKCGTTASTATEIHFKTLSPADCETSITIRFISHNEQHILTIYKFQFHNWLQFEKWYRNEIFSRLIDEENYTITSYSEGQLNHFLGWVEKTFPLRWYNWWYSLVALHKRIRLAAAKRIRLAAAKRNG